MTAPLIPITGIDATFRTPGSYAELLFGQGPATASAGVREVCFVMPMLSTGSWTAATLYPVTSEADAITGAGLGSPLHRAVRKFLENNKNAKCWALPVAETSGGSPIAATSVLTIAVTSTGTGTISATIAGEQCDYTFASGTTASLIGDGIRDSINAKTWLPCTAANSSGTVTVTAKLKGISQGTASLGVIRTRVTITSGVGTTASFGGAALGLSTGAAGVEGSTTEAATTLTALNAFANVRKYYLVSSANDATTLGNFKTHLSTKAEPKQGSRSVCIAAYTGSLATAQTLAIAKNYERLQLVWQRNSDHDCAELAGNMAAIRQKYEAVDSTFNFAGYSGSDWNIKEAFAVSDWLSGDDQNDAINDGITPVASKSGGSYVVMSVDTRSKNSAGTIDDFRACESHRISGADEFVDELLVGTALNFQGKKLKNDEFLADGSVNTNQRIVRGVLTPSQMKPAIFKQLDDYEQAGKLQETQKSKDGLRVLKSPANASRVECGLDLHVIDHAHQFTYRVAEVSTG